MEIRHWGEYIPQVGADTSKLPNGGVYNSFNLAVFGYANNNPVKYNDPDGRLAKEATIKVILYRYCNAGAH